MRKDTLISRLYEVANSKDKHKEITLLIQELVLEDNKPFRPFCICGSQIVQDKKGYWICPVCQSSPEKEKEDKEDQEVAELKALINYWNNT